MKHLFFRIALIISLCFLSIHTLDMYATLDIPWGDIIREPSIEVDSGTRGEPIQVIHSLGFKILSLAKLLISWVALIYLVMIGVYMVAFSETEDRIKAQKNQIIYALVGFLFLNIPGAIYTAFKPGEINGSVWDPSNFSSINEGTIFWNTWGFDDVLGDVIAFLRVFLFGIAVLTLTWGFFQMILSWWDEEKAKQAKTRLTYGSLWLLFLAFVEWWSRVLAYSEWSGTFANTAGKIFSLGLFFAAPIAVFFLLLWAYNYILSWWDEEKVKKWKTILTNTLIASIILIASLSFLNELINFSL